MDYREFDKRRTDKLRKFGLLEPVREGVLTEFGQGAALGAVSALRGFASTAEELGGPAGPRKYFDSVLATNQQWNPDPDYTALSLNPANIARTIGTGAGQTATLLPAIAAGSAVGGLGGAALVGTSVFAQTYGDNLKDYRERFKDRYSENEIRAMSFGRTLVDSAIETGLGNVPLVGKSIRTLINGKAADTVARNALKEASKKFGKETVVKALNNGFTRAVGKGALDEGGEEALQYIQDMIWRSVAGDPSAVLNWGELAENAAAGAWAGAAFGAVDAGTGRLAQRDRRAAMPPVDVAETVSPAWMKHYSVKDDSGAELAGLVASAPEGMSPADFTIVQPTSRAAKAVDGIGRELGLDIRYFVPMNENGAALNGVFARDSDAIYLDAAGTSRNPMQSLGHEFAHYLRKQAPDLADVWDQALNSAANPEARAAEETALRETYGELGDAGAEFSADRMGDMFTDPWMWSRAVQLAEAKQAGFGAKLLKVIDRFISAVKRQLVKFKSSEVEKFITDMDAAREAAAGVVAEFKRRQAGMLVPAERGHLEERTEAGALPPFETYRELQRQQTEEAGHMTGMLKPVQLPETVQTDSTAIQKKPGGKVPLPDTRANAPAGGVRGKESEAKPNDLPEVSTDGADNIYLRMPLERVRKDAAHGVRLAQEALKEREAQTEPEVKPTEQKSAEPTPISAETQKAANQAFEELANGKKIVVKDDSGVHEYEITRWPGEDEVYSVIAAGDKKRRNKFASRGTVTRLIGILGNKFAVLDKEAESAPRAEPYLTVKYDTPFPYKLNGFYTIEQEIERYQNEIDELKAKGKEAPSGYYKQLKLLKGISEQAKSSYNNAVMQYWSDNDRRAYNEFLERQKQKEIDAAMSESNSEPDKSEPAAKSAVTPAARRDVSAELEKFPQKSPERKRILDELPDGEYIAFNHKFKKVTHGAHVSYIYADIPSPLVIFAEEVDRFERSEKWNGMASQEEYDAHVKKAREVFMKQRAERLERGPREIATSTYERAQKRLNKQVEGWLTGRNTPAKKAEYSLSRKPVSIQDFREMPAHPRPERAKFGGLRELYDIYKREYLGKTFTAASGHTITFKPGHFFRLIAGTPKGGRKGMVAKARNAAEAIRMIERGEIGFEDVAGYEAPRGYNIKLFKDVLQEPDFWYTERDGIIFGKKYKGLNKADGFLAATIKIDKKGNIGPLSFHPRKFSDTLLENKELNWNIVKNSAFTKSATGETAEAQSGGITSNITDSGDKSSPKSEFSLNRKPRQQVNPIISNEDIRREYAEELGRNTYTPETVAEWDRKAVDWITRQGGVAGAVEAILNDTEHNDRHVASLVRRHVMNSDVFAKLDEDSRAKLETHHAFTGTEWGREGVARRLAALTLDSVAKVRALFDKLHADLPDKEKTELRNKVLNETGVDIFKLPKDIAENRRKLDAVLRSELAARSSRGDQLYEFWINSILSGPATHVRNVVGNTLNTAYELGPKRAVEAAINVAVRNPKGATFGEMREMWKHLDWKTAWNRAIEAFDLEVLNPAGKYNDHAGVAIGGKKGRIVRVPGRLLRAADEFCKGLIAPVEAAAYAYREGRAQKLSGQELADFINARIKDPHSKSAQWGELRARELAFQEESGAAIRWLVSLKNSDSPAGRIARFIFPFVQAPGNLLRQGVRKSPLGAVSLLTVDLPRAIRSREITPEMMAHAAEQLIAWSTLAALWSAQDDDDDDRPLLTGSGAPYGSNERNFKANKFPPLSVRIGDRYYTYKFFEPLSSGLAVIANGLEAMRAKRPAEVKKALVGMSGFIAEKSYLASVKELFEFFQDPEHSGTRFATNFAASWVPNAYRQAVNAFDGKVRDNRTRARGMKYFTDQFDIVTNSAGFTRALPKLDYFGREIDKDSYADSPAGPLMRLLSVQSATPDRSMDQADRLLWNYNHRNPESAYWPGLPSYYLKQGDRTLYIEGEDYAAFARDAGQLAHKAILSEIRAGRLNVKNPGTDDIKQIKTLFTKARKTAKEKYKGKFHE